MRVLGLETATPLLSAALVDGQGVLGEVTLRAPMRHLEGLLPAVEGLLREIGLTPEDVDAVAVGRGPGGFTSLRIGIATATAWARARGIPVLGVGTLQGLAWGACGAGLVLAALDAHRGEVAASLYHLPDCGDEGRCLLPPLVASPTAVAEEVVKVLASAGAEGPVTVVGDGLLRHGSALLDGLRGRGTPGGAHVHPRGALVGLLARPRLLRGERDDPGVLLPLYGRRLQVGPWQEMPPREGNGL